MDLQMNERIRELADKAGRYRSHNGGINGGPNPALLHGDENIQKFAELLIQKCLEQVRDEVQYEYDWKLADAVSKRVLEHFGLNNESG